MSAAPPNPHLIRRIIILLAVGALVALFANSVSPYGVAWDARFEGDIRVRASRLGLAPLSTSEIDVLLRDPSVLFFDVRHPEYFREGHLPGAYSVPWPDIEEALMKLPFTLEKERHIVVYCASAYCRKGLKAGEWLRERGFARVGLYAEGFDAWELERSEREQE